MKINSILCCKRVNFKKIIKKKFLTYYTYDKLGYFVKNYYSKNIMKKNQINIILRDNLKL